jgi:CRISPR-associated endonuclease/helicase Cas3
MSEWQPYKYQTEVTNLLLSGKSVILQAPTGAGKTAAALLPFLHAWREKTNENFPVKCIYTVPMRVLANQFTAEYEERADSFGRRFKRNLDVKIQTGEHSKDPQFAGDLTFCTIDQFLSSYLTMPYGLPRRLANINAGAFIGSYLVFDEFHLLDPDSTLPSTLYAVKQLSRIAPVLLMTATFSQSVLNALKDELHNAEIVLVDSEEARSIETSFGEKSARQRVWQVSEAELSASAILEKHNNQRSLAICNTVKKAQQIYRDLRDSDLVKEKGIEVLLFHSRFLQEDRQEIEKRIKALFGRDNPEENVIAVTTQVIEVGVDITSETLHTELAPASALIQRAGRCARYAGEQGNVIVYPVEKFSPYGTDSEASAWGKEMKTAFEWLKTHNGEVFDFGKEQEFVNVVATPRDEKILLSLSAGAPIRAEAIHNVLIGADIAKASRLLVRDADSRRVLIHPNPDELTLDPYLAKGFNLPTTTLFGMLKEWLERDVDVDWRVKRLIESKNDEEESNHTEYGWERLSEASQLSATQIIVVNPELAGYLKDEGFVSETGNTNFVSTMPDMESKKGYEGFSYRKESYEDHIKRVLEALQEVSLNELAYSAKALEQAAGWSVGSVVRAAWLACLFHDVGKLSTGWQGWARAYQKEIGMPVGQDFSAGHTEHDRKNPTHASAEKVVGKRYKKPNHAGESALAIAKIVARAFAQNEQDLAKAILTAITRHHTPFANECKIYALEEQAKKHIRATLGFTPDEVQQQINLDLLRSEVNTMPNSFSSLLIAPDDEYGWMAYALLARALRRSDQAGTAKGTQ